MSGLYIAPGTAADADNAARALSFTDSTQRIANAAEGLAMAVTRVDSVELWAPASDSATQVRVALGGRVSFGSDQWSCAESLPYQGGLACRLLLEAWLKDPRELPARINGAGCVVILDSRDHTLHVFTDRLGVFPFYQATGRSFALCSHPDVLADALAKKGEANEIDRTTLAEFFACGCSVQPFTYYKSIQQLDAATHYTWRLGSAVSAQSKRVFWKPIYLSGALSDDGEAVAEALADAVRKAVLRRTQPRLGRPVVLLSGGADSRAALFGARDPTSVTCFTLYDEPNLELRTSQALAAVADAEHRPFQRDADYYGGNAEEAIRISGGFWSLMDAHYTGAAGEIRAVNPGVVLTGCYADYMFKGLLLNRRCRTLFGRNLPLYSLDDFSFEFYQPHVRLRDKWQTLVQQRLESRFPSALRERYAENCLPVEDLRLRPLSREPDVSGRLFLLRTLPWDHWLSDTDILSVYGQLPVALKINGAVFGKAVGRVVGPAGRHIFNNNYGTPVDASEAGRVFWFLIAVLRRKARRALGLESAAPKLATSGSWPDWSYYVAHSEALARLWSNPSASEREWFADYLGRDPWQTSLAEWGRTDSFLFLRLLTARIWLRQRRVSL